MNIRHIPCPPNLFYCKCPYEMTPAGITIHNTANDAPAINEITYMHNNTNYVSYHYAVDDKEAIQGILTNRNAWHAGDGGEGRGNRATIAIEICYSLSGGARFIQAEKNAAKLTAMILNQYGWGIDRVYKHQDWSGKYCPHRTLDMGWNRFLEMVKAELAALQNVVKPAPKPTPSAPTQAAATGYTLVPERAAFTLTVNAINVRTAPSTKAGIVAQYRRGETVYYDSYCIADGYVWISYIGRSGNRRFVAIGNWNGHRRTSVWGTFS